MPAPRLRSFQGRIFVAILLVVLVPAVVAVGAGVVTLQGIGARSGTLGAWDAVAESGRELLDAIDEDEGADPALREAAAAHREALSESVRLSRLYAFVADRFLTFLPVAALVTGALAVAVALLTARWLSRGFGRPIAELAGWTGRISRGEPLPPETEDEARDLAEIATLRAALRAMADEIEAGRARAVEAARLRSWTDLARRVSHELKNPLTPMRMAAVSLAEGGGTEERRSEAALVLAEEIARLEEMARTFAQYGRMPEGPRSRVDLGELAASLAAQYGGEAAGDGGAPSVVVRATGPGATVDAHFDAVARALRNLVANAVEATEAAWAEAPGGPGGGADADGSDATPAAGGSLAPPPSPAVEIDVRTEGAEAVVTVRDRGPGIPADILDEIWNPDVTTKRRGTGLGLAIVRQTVLHHDGAVEAANRPDGGAAFTLRLPAARPDAPSRPSP